LGTKRRAVPPPLAAVMAAALVFLLPSGPAAHEIPNDVTIRMFLKPEGQRLHLLVRARSARCSTSIIQSVGRACWISRGPTRGSATRQPCDRRQPPSAGRDTLLPYPHVVDVRASLASDPSFRSYEEALAHVTGPRLPNTTDFIWNQGLLDVSFEYPDSVGSIRVLD